MVPRNIYGLRLVHPFTYYAAVPRPVYSTCTGLQQLARPSHLEQPLELRLEVVSDVPDRRAELVEHLAVRENLSPFREAPAAIKSRNKQQQQQQAEGGRGGKQVSCFVFSHLLLVRVPKKAYFFFRVCSCFQSFHTITGGHGK